MGILTPSQLLPPVPSVSERVSSVPQSTAQNVLWPHSSDYGHAVILSSPRPFPRVQIPRAALPFPVTDTGHHNETGGLRPARAVLLLNPIQCVDV